jgi:hypothetical protein
MTQDNRPDACETGLPRATALALLAGITLLALALRLAWLGTYPFWHDEAYSLLASEGWWDLLTKGHRVSNHPPLPYVLLAGWRALGFGPGEAGLRLLPALAGTLTIPAVYWLGAVLAGRKTALLAALLLAVSPFHVLHSQDLKEYIYLPLVASLMGAFFYRAARDNRRGDWLAYGLLAGVACYTEAFVAPLLVAMNLWMLAQLPWKRDRAPGWVLSNLLGAAMFAPWLPIMLAKAQGTMIEASQWWIPRPTLLSVGWYLKSVAYGYTARDPLHQAAFFLFCGLAAWGAWRVWRSRPGVAVYLVLWAVLPVAIVFGLSHVTQSIFLYRALIPYSVALYLLAAAGLAGLRPVPRMAGVALMLLLAGTGLNQYYRRDFPPTEFPHRPGTHPPLAFDDVARFLADEYREGDMILVACNGVWMPLHRYGLDNHNMHTVTPRASYRRYVDQSGPRNTHDTWLDPYFPHDIQPLLEGVPRAWYVHSDWEREHVVHNPADVWRWLDTRFTETRREVFHGIEVFCYENPALDPAVRVTGRDRDDGARATVFLGDTRTPYAKVMPDTGLSLNITGPPPGPVLLSFGEPPAAESGGAFRQVVINIANRTSRPAQGTLRVLASDVLIPFAALDAETPEEDFWAISPMYNPAPPPGQYLLHTMTGHFRDSESSMFRTFPLEPGAYSTRISLLTPTGDPALHRAHADIRVNGVPLLDGPALPGTEPAWSWVRGPEITVLENAGGLLVHVRAGSLPGGGESWANLEWLALARTAQDDGVPSDMAAERDILLAPRGEAVFEYPVPAAARRLDAWLFIEGDEETACHIFQTTP